MIEAAPQIEATAVLPAQVYLVRYGAVPEVARFAYQGDAVFARGDRAVIESHRGLQMGTILERQKASTKIKPEELDSRIDRLADATDVGNHQALVRECEEAFAAWCTRIAQWKLELELIDLEWTLDRQKLILYVLCERGPDSTKLALQAAAAGLGIIEVQPVSAEGPIQIAQSGGSCGSGGGGCGCSH